MTRRWARTVGLLVVAVVVGWAGVALASIPDAGGVIHGCRDNRSGALSVIDNATQSCPKGTSALSWNQTGPPGPAGSPGVAGPPGPPGPAGTVASLDALEGVPCNTGDAANVGTTHVAYDNTTHAVSISCPPSSTTTTTPSVTLTLTAQSQATQAVAANPDGTCPPFATQVAPSTCEYRYGGSVQAAPNGPSVSAAFGQSATRTAGYASATTVTVTASPSPGSVAHWGGICASATGTTCTFSITGDSMASVFFGS